MRLVILAPLVLAALSACPAHAQPVDHAMASEQWYDTTDDGHRQYVYEMGHAAAAGDTVLVLHGGWGADHSYLLDALRPLGDAHRLVLYDQRGSLRSPAPDSTITLARLVADLESLRQEIGVDRVTLMAHSMGNHLAYAYLAAHPEHVRGLVLVGAVLPTAFSMEGPGAAFLAAVWPDADTTAVRATFAAAMPAVEARITRRMALEGIIPARFAEPVAADDPDLATAMQAVRTLSDRDRTRAWRIQFGTVNSCDGANWRDTQGGQAFYAPAVARAVMSQPDFDGQVAAMWPTLRAFAGPVRVIDGTCDYTDPGPTVWPNVVDDLQDGRLTVVDGAGHSLWLDRPAEFVAAARAALADATR